MQVGGTELNAVRLAERLDRSRYELLVLCLQEHGPLVARYEAAGIAVHSFPIPSLYGLATLRQGLRLWRFLREQKIRIVHAHDIYSNVFALPWARLAGARTIASRRWWEGLPGIHWRLANRLAYGLADRSLANSPRIGAMLEESERLSPERVVIVPNFVDEDAFTPPPAAEAEELRASLGIHARDRVVGIVANLHAIKDHASLLRAVSILQVRWPELRLVVIGDGDERRALEALARELGIEERTSFAGRRANKPNLHHLFEVSVLCSLSEGLPNSLLEAMAAGRPVVATAVGAIADAVIDGECGLLVPPGDPECLARAIESCLADPKRGRVLGEAARRRAQSHYSPQSALGALEGLYQQLSTRAPISARAADARIFRGPHADRG